MFPPEHLDLPKNWLTVGMGRVLAVQSNEAGAEEPAIAGPWRAKQPRFAGVESLWPGPRRGPKPQDVSRPREAHICPEPECRQGDLDVPWRRDEGQDTLASSYRLIGL